MFVGVKFSKTKTGVTDVMLSRGFPQSARDTLVWNCYFFLAKKAFANSLFSHRP